MKILEKKKVLFILIILIFILFFGVYYLQVKDNLIIQNQNKGQQNKEIIKEIKKREKTTEEVEEIKKSIKEQLENEFSGEKPRDYGACYLRGNEGGVKINYYDGNGKLKIDNSYIEKKFVDKICGNPGELVSLQKVDPKLANIYINCEEYKKSKEECNL